MLTLLDLQKSGFDTAESEPSNLCCKGPAPSKYLTQNSSSPAQVGDAIVRVDDQPAPDAAFAALKAAKGAESARGGSSFGPGAGRG